MGDRASERDWFCVLKVTWSSRRAAGERVGRKTRCGMRAWFVEFRVNPGSDLAG